LVRKVVKLFVRVVEVVKVAEGSAVKTMLANIFLNSSMLSL